MYGQPLFLEMIGDDWKGSGHMDMLYMFSMWVKQCHLHHPPAITILIGGMVTIPKWLVYGIVLATLNYVFDPSDAKMRHEPRHPRDCSCPFGSA